MHRILLFAVLAASAAVYTTGHQDLLMQFASADNASAKSKDESPAIIQQMQISAPGHEEIKANKSGHFVATFQVNGRSVSGLIDTGATFVALNETTARSLGVSRSDLDYRYAVTTANGMTQAAHITLDRMEIGGVRVRNVEAYVLKDKSLTGMLVGMSFLNRLASYKVESGILYLKS